MAFYITAYSKRWGDLQNLARAYANIRHHHDPVLEHSREVLKLVSTKEKKEKTATASQTFAFQDFIQPGLAVRI